MDTLEWMKTELQKNLKLISILNKSDDQSIKERDDDNV